MTGARQMPKARGFASLTERELEALRLTALGYKKKEVAELMGIKISTARTYLEKIAYKLEISTPTATNSGGPKHLLTYVATALKFNLISVEQLLDSAAD